MPCFYSTVFCLLAFSSFILPFIVGYSNSHKFPKNLLKVPSFPELEQMYWDEFKRRQSLMKEMRKKVSELGWFVHYFRIKVSSY